MENYIVNYLRKLLDKERKNYRDKKIRILRKMGINVFIKLKNINKRKYNYDKYFFFCSD